MGSQGTQGRLYVPLSKQQVKPSIESDPPRDADDTPGPVADPGPVLIHGDFRESSAEQPRPHRPFFVGGKIRLFGHFVPLQFLLLAFIEALAFAGAGYLGLHYTEAHSSAPVGWPAAVQQILPIPVALVLALGALGLYSAHQRADLGGVLSRAVLGFGVAFAVLEVGYRLLPGMAVEQDALLVVGLAAAAAFALIRAFFYQYLDGALLVRRVLVVGTGKRANSIERLRRKTDQRGFNLMGFVDVGSGGGCVHVNSDRIVTSGQRFCRYALDNRIDEIVVALDDRRQGTVPTDELLNCRMSGIEVTDMLDFFERETAKIRLDLLRPSWLIHADGFRRHVVRDFAKRAFDIILSTILLVFTFPFMLLTAAAIAIESGGRGSVFYRQQRVGKDGRPFDLIKFRSMRMDAEKDGKARWAAENDPRVTRVGNFIRKYRLDELPQLWNVLRNDMSIVGPRPERPEFVEQLTRLSPLYKERHRVKPGIAGWAQLRYPYGASEQDSIEKLQYDLYYVKNHRLLFDLYILVQTVEVVIYSKGAR